VVFGKVRIVDGRPCEDGEARVFVPEPGQIHFFVEPIKRVGRRRDEYLAAGHRNAALEDRPGKARHLASLIGPGPICGDAFRSQRLVERSAEDMSSGRKLDVALRFLVILPEHWEVLKELVEGRLLEDFVGGRGDDAVALGKLLNLLPGPNGAEKGLAGLDASYCSAELRLKVERGELLFKKLNPFFLHPFEQWLT
jgi:hypothetical protein